MCQAIEDIYKDGKKAGIKTGIKTGIKEGRTSLITQMLQNGLPVSEIRKYTDATDEEISNAEQAVHGTK
ncbi:hypothetical protein B5F07_08445 [Lachnoclostridium sp. An169]|uniref:hypothetical protein n=1 Tax=Lachnoclostridium sp. An169 TaxID=1965569 RepID=UPI000B3AA926|nr:hypothetical protein [Lachnoclostridium sp. An169]OUP84156.1 hypothetical protein B5F07_08445 [Lachnoclostridium sp. An169]